MEILASLRGATVRYGAVTALQGLDLDVRKGELLALLGRNGAGKSTAISLMLGLQSPDSGTARLFGRSPADIAVRRAVGVMMQETVQPSELTVRELIRQVSGYYPAPLEVDAAISLAGVESIADRRYGKLSGGQKRQAQFALAICGSPSLLFVDEPSANLDAEARQTLWAAIRRLVGGGTAIVLTTHYIEEAEALADRVAIIDGGRCIASGTVADLQRVIQRKRIECQCNLPLADVAGWPDVEEAQHDGARLSLATQHPEAVLRRLLAADPHLDLLEVSRGGLSAALATLTEEQNQ
jgi:ABC-2 type transport system ATP-binding protein